TDKTPPPNPATGVPDWIADVGRSETRPAATATPPLPLNWLEDIRQIEDSLIRAAQASKSSVRADTVSAAFVQARKQLQEWVEAVENQSLIKSSDSATLRQLP